MFVQATLGLADVAGIRTTEEDGERVAIDLDGRDPGALLVDWLSEVLWLHDSRDALLGGIEVDEVGDGVRGAVSLVPRGDRSAEGTQVKAVTYHRLRVAPLDDGWTAEVYLDV